MTSTAEFNSGSTLQDNLVDARVARSIPLGHISGLPLRRLNNHMSSAQFQSNSNLHQLAATSQNRLLQCMVRSCIATASVRQRIAAGVWSRFIANSSDVMMLYSHPASVWSGRRFAELHRQASRPHGGDRWLLPARKLRDDIER